MDNEELAERIGYKIQSMLSDKYTNSLKIVVGIIEQELRKSEPVDSSLGDRSGAARLLEHAYKRLVEEGHAGWCKVFPANRIGNNSYTYGESEEKFCTCGIDKWKQEVERLPKFSRTVTPGSGA